jgi:hypothetical protein
VSGVSGMSDVFVEVVDLAKRRGVTEIFKLEGCWEVTLPGGWHLSLNGHREPTKNTTGDEVPPFALYVRHRGLPAAVVGWDGGEIIATDGVTEASLLAAIKGAT